MKFWEGGGRRGRREIGPWERVTRDSPIYATYWSNWMYNPVTCWAANRDAADMPIRVKISAEER
jgi:hypothetical protein